jgi:four helix bundle protein
MEYKKDIKEWTLDFAVKMVKYSNELKRNKIDLDLISQVRRSGTSVGANVREAKASSSRKELTRFYEIALRSANETDYWIDVINKGYDYNSKTQDSIQVELSQLEKMLGKIIVNLKANN